jgi:cytochrome b involved in lipid metabolism
MSRQVFLLSTIAFWIALIGVASLGEMPSAPAMAEKAGTGDRVISPAELAQHASPEDCWMAIHGAVHELDAYLPEHPSRPDVILPWCGREASEAYDTKLKGRPHSTAADQLLARYRIGVLASPP